MKAGVGALIIAFVSASLWATDLVGAKCYSAKQYPSLVPVNVLQVPLTMAVGVSESHWEKIGWKPERAASYKVTRATGSVVPVIRVEFPHNSKARDIDRTLAYLILPADITTDDKLTVILLSVSGTELAKTPQPVAVESAVKYAVSMNPQAVPNEDLVGGRKRDVGQLSAKLDLPSITPAWKFARTYVTTDNLISTDERDKKSKVGAKLGVERSLALKWYLPVHIENEVQGDQVGNNLSYLVGAGFSTVLPWAFTKSILYNSGVQIPTSPTFALDVKYERRISQDADSQKKFPTKNTMRLHEKSTWKAWRLLPGLIGQDTAWLELNGEAWYLPLEENNSGRRIARLEGAGDVSLYISLAKFSKVPGINVLTNSDPVHTAVRVGYSGGANEANGFKCSEQWIFGLVVTK